MAYNPQDYYIDFSSRSNLDETDKVALERIQNTFLPIERIPFLSEYCYSKKITEDDYETCTGCAFFIR